MSHKKLALCIVLAGSSVFAGSVFGLLDIFGFVDGRHTLSLSLLLASAGLLYATLVTTFLMNYVERDYVQEVFIGSSILFGIPFYAMNPHVPIAILATLLYLTFLMYVRSASHQRSTLFIRFSPRELFFPILRGSFTFFLILLAVMAFTQSQKLVSHNSLVSPSLIRLISKPTIFMLNQQINAQMHSGVSSEILNNLPPSQRKIVIHQALEKTVEQMANPQTKTIYGFTPQEVPVELATVSPSNNVNIAPIIEAMLPSIAYKLNIRIQKFSVLAPFAVALITFLLLQPFIIPLQLIESLFTVALFKLLLSTGFIRLQKATREVDVPTL